MILRNRTGSQKGFTLIEVVIAISIFALLGFACYKVVHGLVLAKDTITKNTDELGRLVKAMNMINKDFTQLTPRKITDLSNKNIPAIYTQGDYKVEFTRTGVENPLMLKRAKVVRIAYQFKKELDSNDLKQIENNPSLLDSLSHRKDGYLIRYMWPVLDRGSDQMPQMHILMTGITDLNFEYLVDENKWSNEWPPSGLEPNAALNELPYAVRIKVDTIRYGSLERLFLIHELPSK